MGSLTTEMHAELVRAKASELFPYIGNVIAQTFLSNSFSEPVIESRRHPRPQPR